MSKRKVPNKSVRCLLLRKSDGSHKFKKKIHKGLNLTSSIALNIKATCSGPSKKYDSQAMAKFIYYYQELAPNSIVNVHHWTGTYGSLKDRFFLYKISLKLIDELLNLNQEVSVFGWHFNLKKSSNVAAGKILTIIDNYGLYPNLPREVLSVTEYTEPAYVILILILLVNENFFVDAVTKVRKSLSFNEKISLWMVEALFLLHRAYTKAVYEKSFNRKSLNENDDKTLIMKNKTVLFKDLHLDGRVVKLMARSHDDSKFEENDPTVSAFQAIAEVLEKQFSISKMQNPFESILEGTWEILFECSCGRTLEIKKKLSVLEHFLRHDTIHLDALFESPSKIVQKASITRNYKCSCEREIDNAPTLQSCQLSKPPYFLTFSVCRAQCPALSSNNDKHENLSFTVYFSERASINLKFGSTQEYEIYACLIIDQNSVNDENEKNGQIYPDRLHLFGGDGKWVEIKNEKVFTTFNSTRSFTAHGPMIILYRQVRQKMKYPRGPCEIRKENGRC